MIEKQVSCYDNFIKVIENLVFKNETKDDFLDYELEDKLKIYVNKIQNLISSQNKSIKEITKNNDDNSSGKIIELYNKVEKLQLNNLCLESENEKLKAIVNQKENINFDDVKSKLEIVNLTAKLNDLDINNKQLIEKYHRNKKVWEKNEQRLTEEIGKLDNFIAILIDTLRNLPDNIRNSSELQEIISFIEQNENDKSINKL